jgi:hypothetical protein
MSYNLLNEIQRTIHSVKEQGLTPKTLYIDEHEYLEAKNLLSYDNSEIKTIIGLPFVFDSHVMPIAPFVILDENQQHHYGRTKTPAEGA